MVSNQIRVAVFSIHPAPYRDPFLSRLAATPGITLNVYTFLKQDLGHDFWKLPPPAYPNTFLPSVSFTPRFLQYHWSVLRLVLWGGHDIYVFPGFVMRASVTGMLACAWLGTPFVYSADSVADGPSTSGVLGRLKQFLIQRAAFLFIPGKASEAYFHKRYDVPTERMCRGCYALDSEHIELRLARARERRAEIRHHMGVGDGDTLFLMVANMTRNRLYPITTAGFLAAAERHPDARFVVVGNGVDYDAMNDLAERHPSLVVKRGCSFDEMLALYGAADVYVHGGQEPASTALVIGALAELPLLSSLAVGHSWDCLVDGVSGILIPDHTSATDWAYGFARLMMAREKWLAFGRAARQAVKELDVVPCVDAFVESLARALSNDPALISAVPQKGKPVVEDFESTFCRQRSSGDAGPAARE